MAGGRVPCWDCPVCVVGLGLVALRGARRSPFSEKPASQLPWLRVEGREPRAARSRLRRNSGAGRAEPGSGGGGGSPPPGSSRQRRARGPRGGGAPQHRLPPPGRERAGKGGPGHRAPPVSTCGPGTPGRGSLGPLPPGSRREVHPWKSTPGVKAKPALTRRGVAPQRGPRFVQVRWGRGGCAALRGLRRPPSALHRGCSSDFLFLGLGPAARPRPGPPLSARSCGLRRQRAADPPVPPPLCPGARKVGRRRGREKEKD